MDNNDITAIATVLLVVVGVGQVVVLIVQLFLLISQKNTQKIDLVEVYRKRWSEYKEDFGVLVFIGREQEEYYQVIDIEKVARLNQQVKGNVLNKPTIWARDSDRNIGNLFSDICIRILKGNLTVQEVYPILGTEILRQSLPLRQILERGYLHGGNRWNSTVCTDLRYKHLQVRTEVQDWLIYHDGIRRRCLILIDLLWAEAARLEDLPPSDLVGAARAKEISGKKNRVRLKKECLRLNGSTHFIFAYKLATFLKYSEYRVMPFCIGLSKKRLDFLEKEWVDRLLNKR
jgi:hypothetical protein